MRRRRIGTVHLEGLLVDGQFLGDGIAIATQRAVQIQNVRVERAHDNIKGAHADCVQVQQGVGRLRMDRFTCSTERQGVFLGDHDGPDREVDLRRVNLYGAPGKAPALAVDTELSASSPTWSSASRAGLAPVGAVRVLGLPAAGRADVQRVGVDEAASAVVSRDGKRSLVHRVEDQRRRAEGSAGAADFVPAGRSRDVVHLAGLRAQSSG